MKVPEMLRWSQFTAARPELAAEANAMLYQWSVGLGFLATVRPDGGPRVHPICPLLADELYGFIIEGPKLRDLRRDGRYALHSETFAPPRQDDGVYLAGVVAEIDDPPLRATLAQQFLDERSMIDPWPGFEEQTLVEFNVDTVLLTLTESRAGFPAGNTIWHG